MAWYYGTFSCGHEGRVNIIGPHKFREYKKERAFEKMCPDCWEQYKQEEREKANKEAAEKAKEMELPELKGTEKQVAWANTIRQQLIDRLNREIDDLDDDEIEEKEALLKVMDWMIQNKNNASWYIDNRNRFIDFLIDDLEKEIPTEKEIEEKHLEMQIKAEATVYPENAKYKTVAEIKIVGNKIQAFYEKNKDFIDIVKSLGYKWNGIWEREIDYTKGTVEDRAAELGNKLLNAGFPICVLDEDIRQKAINGEYEEECKRWIYIRTSGKYKDWFVIKWQGKNDRLYNVARKLPGSRWNDGVVVKIEYFEEVEEFAELQGFKFSKGAIEAIEAYNESLKKVEVVDPAEAKEIEQKDGLKEILSSDTCILPDLLDEGE